VRESPLSSESAWSRRGVVAAVLALCAVLVVAVVYRGVWRGSARPSLSTPAPAPLLPAFVGAQSCASCHSAEYEMWRGSHHALAMMEASDAAVLGDFEEARFTYAGVTSTFFRRDGRFMVRTDGPDGALTEFEVSYTFGVYPLQQYLIAFPGGRLQALSIAWDSRPREQGGQRWFHLYPDERITHTDPLHWTGLQQNWNYMCADCHSTNLRKNYDPAADRYATTWSEINVACEACHGPGSDHIAWAERNEGAGGNGKEDMGLTVRLSRPAAWTTDPASGQPVPAEERHARSELAVCAQCHSRRGQFSDEYVAGEPFFDHYSLELLLPDLYHPDGQQKDEVFTHGSFLQSRMYQAGVTCSNCHDPHSGQLRAPGNLVCGQCHLADRYDAPEHHFHPAGSTGAECVGCHMPPTTYMVVDPRRDHSFLVPRPALSAELGVPDPCTGCHTDRSAGWAADHVGRWYGGQPGGYQRFAEAFHADEHAAPRATAELLAVTGDATHPAIVRASALERLARRPSPALVGAARVGLRDPDPAVRRAALSLVETLPPGERVSLAAGALGDPIRSVRIQAAWVLAAERRRLMLPDQQVAFQRAADEFIAAYNYLADRPESRTTLGSFLVQLRRFEEAEAQYRAALVLLPGYVPASINLADLHRAQQREADAERVLRDALVAAPGTAVLHHSLGLSLARTGRTAEAVRELERAAGLAPEDSRLVYTYAVALHSTGSVAEAIRTLDQALARDPENREILFALAAFHRDAGNRAEAIRYADRLLEIDPEDPQAQVLRRSLMMSMIP
jgi:tetratricopeptide (TPR) repeat protein